MAPLALVGALLAIGLVVRSATSSPDRPGPRRSTSTQGRATTTQARAVQQTYVVKPGDILSVVAERTGVPVARIQELNPDVDVNELQPGQKLKLAPGAS